ncbi:MAG: M48 family metalloprotease [bacterium]|nr:M48 family metalloprotease [bacterium]
MVAPAPKAELADLATTELDPAELDSQSEVQVAGSVSPTASETTPISNTNEPTGAWRVWMAGLVGVRDALRRLPAFPTRLWLGGVAVMLAWYGGQILLFRRRLGQAEAAPRRVVREVAQIARRFGLSRLPETLMVDDRLSPLVWCGRRTRLVLPRALWSELDRRGRQAILSHEMAHLRRRDHWVCRFELMVSVLCWWHPLVWWVRRHIQEQADLCCDAWVTWLMPRSRRTYAEALIKTKHYCSGGRVVPAAGMGVTTARARSFARRLTMVMTERNRPRYSLAGLGLICTLAAVGWWIAPALACPPKCEKPDKPAQPAKAPVAISVGPGLLVVPDAPEPAPCGTAPTPPSAVIPLTFSGAVGIKSAPTSPVTLWADELVLAAGDDDKKLAKRLARLEKQLQKMAEELEAVSSQLSGGGGRGRGGDLTPLFAPPANDNKKEMVRKYVLPEGKLEALTALMSRSDVPVLIEPGEEVIVVHGTARQQAIFAAFVELIHPTGEYKDTGASFYAPFDFDPRLTPRGSGRTRSEARQRLRESRRLRSRADGDAGASLFWQLSEARSQAAAQAAQAEAQARWELDEQRAQAEAHRAQLEAEKRQALHAALAGDQAHKLAEEIAHQIEAMLAEAAELEHQSQAMESEAERLADEAERVRDEADEVEDEPRQQRDLERQARALERQARQLETQARRLAQQAERLEDQANELEADAEDLQDELAEIAIHEHDHEDDDDRAHDGDDDHDHDPESY